MMPRVLLLLSLGTVLFLSVPEQVGAQEPVIAKPIQSLIGENYLYFIDFLFFKKLAAGELRFSGTDQTNIYRAELVGRTLGIASWLTGERTQTYSSLMELTEDGSLRSIEHAAKVDRLKRGRWQSRGRSHLYDYEQGEVIDEKTEEGLFRSRKVHDIPEGQQPVDMLTAFCNLRMGVYGPLVRGAHFMIATYSSDGFTEIEVNVLTLEQQAKHKYFPAQGLLVQAKIDPKIFENGNGILYVWFNSAGVPERGIVEDMVGLGDIMGYLDKGGL